MPSPPDPTIRAAGHGLLKRELGVFAAMMMGLGSIIGTGVFVSIGIAAGIAGPAVALALVLAAGVAVCNGLSSAQLAANHAYSGGTYEYGYAFLRPWLGFLAGWMFLCAKSASAATAAMGFSGYVLGALGIGDGVTHNLVAAATAVLLTLIVLGGIRRSSLTNIVIVSVTLLALFAFIIAGGIHLGRTRGAELRPFFGEEEGPLRRLLHATALMFVAYTGYGRIATLGEEVHEPRRTIPRAIIATLAVSALLYIAVGTVAVAALGARPLAEATESGAPLEAAARTFGIPWVPWVVAIGAATAMLGVLINLILGLSRVLLAMGRRGDMPAAVARLDAGQTTPYVAVIVVGLVIAVLAAFGSVRTTWTFSAFTVLIYYAITNLAALRLRPDQRLYSPLFPWGGLAACLFLAMWVDPAVLVAGAGLIVLGLLWRVTFRRAAQH